MRLTASRRLPTAMAAVSAIVALGIGVPAGLQAQGPGQTLPPPPPTLGLENGTLDFDTPDFTLNEVGQK